MVWEPILLINAILCIVVLLHAYWGYTKLKQGAFLYIALAFAIFAISHIFNLFGLATNTTILMAMIIIRTIAYFLIIVALAKLLAVKKSA